MWRGVSPKSPSFDRRALTDFGICPNELEKFGDFGEQETGGPGVFDPQQFDASTVPSADQPESQVRINVSGTAPRLHVATARVSGKGREVPTRRHTHTHILWIDILFSPKYLWNDASAVITNQPLLFRGFKVVQNFVHAQSMCCQLGGGELCCFLSETLIVLAGAETSAFHGAKCRFQAPSCRVRRAAPVLYVELG